MRAAAGGPGRQPGRRPGGGRACHLPQPEGRRGEARAPRPRGPAPLGRAPPAAAGPRHAGPLPPPQPFSRPRPLSNFRAMTRRMAGADGVLPRPPSPLAPGFGGVRSRSPFPSTRQGRPHCLGRSLAPGTGRKCSSGLGKHHVLNPATSQARGLLTPPAQSPVGAAGPPNKLTW